MTVVAGIDSSTQSTKIEWRNLDSGAVVGCGSAAHPVTTPPRSEQDPESWWNAFIETWKSGPAHPTTAISVAGQQHGMVTLDALDQVIRPAKLWNDTESSADADWLIKQLPGGASDWAQACGSVPVAAFTVSKLSWLHRNEPHNWERVAKVLLPHDWMTYRLSGGFVTDRGDASGTGYWSPFANSYRYDLLEIIDNDRDWVGSLPTVLGPLDSAGEWHGAVVGPGTGDNMAAALGLGLQPGDVMMSFGTSGTVFTVAPQPTSDSSGAVAGFADASGHYLPLVCTLNATKVTDAIARLLGVDHAGFDALALAQPLGAGGLCLLPYLDGERTPNRPTSSGLLGGLRSNVTREQLARASVAGVVCGMLEGFDALQAQVGGLRRVIMVGGGSRSAAYRQTLADLSELDVFVADAEQAVSTGACVQAAAVLDQVAPSEIAQRWGLGGGVCVERSPNIGPDQIAEVRDRYAQLRNLQQ